MAYLDNSATTRPHEEVLRVMWEVYADHYGNPSSIHTRGLEAERIVRGAEEVLADMLNASPEEIIFTSGASEANNIAIQGIAKAYRRKGKHLVTSTFEHSSVLETMKALEKQGFEVTYVNPKANGMVSVKDIGKAIRKDTILVSLMHVNNEIGTIQSIEEIGKILGPGTFLHVDAVQGFGRVPLDVRRMGIDLLSLSGHKIMGPKGIGALYIRQGVRVAPVLYGGGQGQGLRPGTENVPGIRGLAEATRLWKVHGEEWSVRVQGLKEQMIAGLQVVGEIRVNGDLERAVPHIVSVSFADVPGEVLVHSLAKEGVFVSTGSACSSKHKGSHVLHAIGLDERFREGTLRVSFSPMNTQRDVEMFLEAIGKVVPLLQKMKRRR